MYHFHLQIVLLHNFASNDDASIPIHELTDPVKKIMYKYDYDNIMFDDKIIKIQLIQTLRILLSEKFAVTNPIKFSKG